MIDEPKPTTNAIIKNLRSELASAHKVIAFLSNQLAQHNLKGIDLPPEWAKYLSIQEIELMSMLLQAHPRCLTRDYLEENLISQDRANDRRSNIVGVVVSNVRGSLGKSVIETYNRLGYKCSDEFAKKYKIKLVNTK